MHTGNNNPSHRGAPPTAGRAWRSVVGQSLSLAVALIAAAAALAALLWLPRGHEQEQQSRPGSEQPEDVVHLDGPRRIAIKQGGPLGTKLAVASAQSESIVAPLLS